MQLESAFMHFQTLSAAKMQEEHAGIENVNDLNRCKNADSAASI
jgi:hypothetical protein